MTPEEIKCLSHYASKPGKLAVEIGVYQGGSTVVISNSLSKGAKLVSIDPFIPDSMMPTLRGSLIHSFLNVLRHGNICNVRFIKDYSYNVVRGWKKQIDFLWIDGSHVYHDVKMDFEMWSPLVTRGGYILFHDSNRSDLSNDNEFQNGWCGPTRVCKEIKNELGLQYEMVESVKSINVFRKL